MFDHYYWMSPNMSDQLDGRVWFLVKSEQEAIERARDTVVNGGWPHPHYYIGCGVFGLTLWLRNSDGSPRVYPGVTP